MSIKNIIEASECRRMMSRNLQCQQTNERLQNNFQEEATLTGGHSVVHYWGKSPEPQEFVDNLTRLVLAVVERLCFRFLPCWRLIPGLTLTSDLVDVVPHMHVAVFLLEVTLSAREDFKLRLLIFLLLMEMHSKLCIWSRAWDLKKYLPVVVWVDADLVVWGGTRRNHQ